MTNNKEFDKLIEFVKSIDKVETKDLENKILEELKKANAKKENPFDVKNGEKAYFNNLIYTKLYSKIWKYEDLFDYVPCKDKSIVEQRQKRHHLNDLLEKFAYENNANVTDKMWKDEYLKYCIRRDYDTDSYYIETVITVSDLFSTYFTSKEVAEKAITEVVVPFMECK